MHPFSSVAIVPMQDLNGGNVCRKEKVVGGMRSDEGQWYRPVSLFELASVFSEATQSSKTIKLLCGDTGRGECEYRCWNLSASTSLYLLLLFLVHV